MKKLILLAIATFAAASTAALADNTSTQEKKITVVPAVRIVQPVQVSRAVRLSDAELDKITAGKADHLTGGGLTLVLNPGKAMVGPEGPKFTHRNLICINCF